MSRDEKFDSSELAILRAELTSMIATLFREIGTLKRRTDEHSRVIASLTAHQNKRQTGNLERASALIEVQYQRWAAVLKTMITDAFNLDELDELCHDLSVDREAFPAEKPGFVRELVEHFRRRGNLAVLASYCQMTRPNNQWPLNAPDAGTLGGWPPNKSTGKE